MQRWREHDAFDGPFIRILFIICYFCRFTFCSKIWVHMIFYLFYSRLLYNHRQNVHIFTSSLCAVVCLSFYLSACLPICLSVCLSLCLSACLPICLSVCLSLPVCIAGCLFIRATTFDWKLFRRFIISSST